MRKGGEGGGGDWLVLFHGIGGRKWKWREDGKEGKCWCLVVLWAGHGYKRLQFVSKK